MTLKQTARCFNYQKHCNVTGLPSCHDLFLRYFHLNSDHTGADRTPWSGKPKLRDHTRDQLARAMSYNKQKFKNRAMQVCKVMHLQVWNEMLFDKLYKNSIHFY